MNDRHTKALNPSSLVGFILNNTSVIGEVLDLGCGSGYDTLFLATKNKVTAVDKSSEALDYLKAKAIEVKLDNRIDIVNKDISRLDIIKNKYDIILANNSLQFLNKKDSNKLIKNAIKSVKKGGLVAIAVFNTDDALVRDISSGVKSYFKPQELLKTFKNFKILYFFEGVINEDAHKGCPEAHQHSVSRIIAQKI
jgi:SAM-dependent methyltransferase